MPEKFHEMESINDEELFAINLLLDGGALEAFLLIVAAMMAANRMYFDNMLNSVRKMITDIGTETLIKIGNGND